MSKTNDTNRPHSSEYFGEERDFFWNIDFLDLIAKRLDLRAVRRAADIGCGVGHWSSLLYGRLASEAELTGVDREQSHVVDYLRRLRAAVTDPARIDAREGDATSLPLPDRSFDLVTCQTLLLHLQNPEAALEEMVRIARPGGLILCVEPNNLVGRLPFSGLMGIEPPERLIRLSEMAWRYALGRARLGKGAEFIGEQLPGMFARLGLQDVSVWLCDKVSPSLPPYSSAGEIAAFAALDRWRAEGTGPYDREEMRANVIAGGGTEAFFDTAWRDYLDHDREATEAIREHRWHAAGGTLFYIVAGRRPTH
ncbi:MAG: class I SAM-dependent methyltransferase [Microvirga sp.]